MLGCALFSFELLCVSEPLRWSVLFFFQILYVRVLSMCVIMNCYACFVTSFAIFVALSLCRWMVAPKNW
jgi:hypothetical protein